MPFQHPGAPRDPAIALSVVLPVHNEEGNLPALGDELAAALAAVGGTAEVVFVNDGSTDGSGAWLDGLRARDPRVRVLDHDRNHGLTAALDTGFRAARGAVLAMLDADLQNPPGELVHLLARLPEADMVIGWRRDRRDPFVKRVTSKIANAYRNWRTNEQVHDTGCALKVFRREVRATFYPFTGLHRFLPTLAEMHGYKVVEIPVNHRERASGSSKYGVFNRVFRGMRDMKAVQWMRERRMTYRVERVGPGESAPR